VTAATEVVGSLLLDASQAPLLARPYFADGDPGPIVAALAQVPELLEVALPFIGTALGPSAISFRAKEIVIVRTSALAGCRYCVQVHTAVALDAGLSTDEVRVLRGEAGVENHFPEPRERALLEWVDTVALPGPVDDDARARVRRCWADHEVVELTAVIGATLLLNRFATALALPTGADTLTRLVSEGFA
jgi:AhpD family alkylhydroperoxidase